MSKTRPPYAAAFRQQMVELVRSGRTPGDLAREFEPSAQTIRTWVAQADRDSGTRTDGPRTEEREEVRQLRREVRRLREERDILTPLYVKKCFGQLIERETSFGAAVSEATVVDCAYGRWSNVAAGPGVTSGERPYRQGRDRLCAGLRWPRTVCKRRSRVSLRIVTGFIHV